MQSLTVEKPSAVGAAIEEESTGNQDQLVDVNNVPEKEINITGDLGVISLACSGAKSFTIIST